MISWFHKRRALKISTLCFILLFSGVAITCVSSCNIINPTEGVPAYLKIDTFSFTAAPGQGSASTHITDVWAYADGSVAGIVEMPKTFPVLDSGSTQLILGAGIWDNGIAEARVTYPFYYPDTMTLNLKPTIIYPITPHFTYRSNTKFFFIEDFEAGNLFDKIGGDTNIVRTSNPDEVYEGTVSAAIYLDEEHSVYEGRTSSSYVLTKGNPVYVELNYKCDQSFQVGLYGTQFGASAFLYKWTINPKNYWNKIYLNMGSDVQSMQADNYQILIRAVLDPERSSSNIYVDNVKLVSN